MHFTFFLSIKVISESSEALVCKERRVKRGEIDSWAVRASHQKVSLHVCTAGLSNRLRPSEGSRLPHVKLDALLIIKTCTIRSDTPIFSPIALLYLSIFCLSTTH